MELTNPYLLISISVLMHVTWNLLARYVDSKSNFLWWGLLAHLLLLGPYSIWQLIQNAVWNTTLVTAIVVTALANAFYFISLRRAYHYAPVALVYPLARSSPLLILLWSWLFFSQEVSQLELLAIISGVVGLWVLAGSSRCHASRRALPWTAAAALATSLYSLSDKAAIQYLPGFAEQLGFISFGYATSFFALTLLQKAETGRWCPPSRPTLLYILVGGLFIGTAYALVVRSMRELPAAHVVSFTNAGIVLAVLLSITLFKERAHWKQRTVGALIISASLIALGLVQPFD